MSEDRNEKEEQHTKKKRTKSKNLWNELQKKRAWKLFENKILDPENLPAKKQLLLIAKDYSEFRNYLNEKRYPQLREHLRKLAPKFIVWNELRHKRRTGGKLTQHLF